MSLGQSHTPLIHICVGIFLLFPSILSSRKVDRTATGQRFTDSSMYHKGMKGDVEVHFLAVSNVGQGCMLTDASQNIHSSSQPLTKCCTMLARTPASCLLAAHSTRCLYVSTDLSYCNTQADALDLIGAQQNHSKSATEAQQKLNVLIHRVCMQGCMNYICEARMHELKRG